MTVCEHPDAYEFGPFRLQAQSRRLLCNEEEVVIGGRAMDLILALAARRGQLVSKEQLFQAVWPGCVVHESNLKVTVASLRRVLRQWAKGAEHIRTVVGRGYWLDFGTSNPHAFVGSNSSLMGGVPLPDIGDVIGRDRVIAEVREMLSFKRLTTLVGAGGIGKTTVAIVAAHLYADEVGVGAAFVDLARVGSEEFVAATLASALGITPGGGDAVDAIVSILGQSRTLLVLDTCEHVSDEVAHLCNVILAKVADVRVLATSRQVLRAREENVVWLAPLDVPPPGQGLTATDVLRYSAPQLLVTRALENGGYRLHDDDAPAIGEICRRLDGAPLAIELVAPRLTLRGVRAVQAELDDRLGNLRRDDASVPLRQQTLLVTLEWSYTLLTNREASVLRAVAIFSAPFSADAVVRVMGHKTLDLNQIYEAIDGLRAKSMLGIDPHPRELRYRLLDTTRVFANGLLESCGEFAAVAAAHAGLQLETQRRARLEYTNVTARQWHGSYANQIDDLRKAVHWALADRNDLPLGMQLVAEGLTLWQELSLEEEARRLCELALTEFGRLGSLDVALKLNLVIGVVTANAYVAQDFEKSVSVFEEAIRLARQVRDHGAEFRALGGLATFKVLPHDAGAPEALDAFERAALLSRDRSKIWEAQQLRAVFEVGTGKVAAGRDRLQQLKREMAHFPVDAVTRLHVHPKINVHVQAACLEWIVGRPGKALESIADAVREAQACEHGLTLIHALGRGAVWLSIQCHDYANSIAYTEILRRCVYLHGMTGWLPLVEAFAAVNDASTRSAPSAERLRSAAKGLEGVAVLVSHQPYAMLLIDAMLRTGAVQDAAQTLERISAKDGGLFIKPELLRLRAATERVFASDETAMATLVDSIRLAGKIGALCWKMRSSIDLAKIHRDRHQHAKGRLVLAPVFAEFSDGFSSGDLQSARKLLEELEGRTEMGSGDMARR